MPMRKQVSHGSRGSGINHFGAGPWIHMSISIDRAKNQGNPAFQEKKLDSSRTDTNPRNRTAGALLIP